MLGKINVIYFLIHVYPDIQANGSHRLNTWSIGLWGPLHNHIIGLGTNHIATTNTNSQKRLKSV